MFLCSLQNAQLLKTNTTTQITKKQIQLFQKKIFSFYSKHGRNLPWRQTTDPYKILLSEFMLQQTQVSRVIQYYNKWIAQWPTIHDLARAPRKQVLQEWMGLGYNTRGVNLHKTAQTISKTFKGDIIQALSQYEQLPGIGRYTAQAIHIFATNRDIATVDTNIRRILIHEFHLPETISSTALWELAHRCLPVGKSRDWHNALMDYGALYLTSKKTGIAPITKQTKFIGSDRQIRAQILRETLNHPVSEQALQKKLKIPPQRLRNILSKMITQQLLSKKNNIYEIQEK